MRVKKNYALVELVRNDKIIFISDAKSAMDRLKVLEKLGLHFGEMEVV